MVVVVVVVVEAVSMTMKGKQKKLETPPPVWCSATVPCAIQIEYPNGREVYFTLGSPCSRVCQYQKGEGRVRPVAEAVDVPAPPTRRLRPTAVARHRAGGHREFERDL